MAYVEITLPDHERIYRQISDLPTVSDQVLYRTMQLYAEELAGRMREKTPSNLGHTRASIEVREEGPLHFGIGSYSRGHILRWLDLGRGPVRPVTKKALHFFIGDEEVFSMYSRATEPLDIMQSSVDETWFRLEQIFNEEFRKC